jgi:hypothetical protein
MATRGGSPYFLAKALARLGFGAAPLSLKMEDLYWGRLLWILSRLLCLRHPRGFQYSPAFSRAVFLQWPRMADGDVVISWHPFVVPEDFIVSRSLIAYIDCTQSQVFNCYSKSVKS